VFGLRGTELLGVVVMAALPTAQNVYLFATQFKLPSLIARDVIFVSSFAAFPVILAVAFLLGA
jgi:predicted permease